MKRYLIEYWKFYFCLLMLVLSEYFIFGYYHFVDDSQFETGIFTFLFFGIFLIIFSIKETTSDTLEFKISSFKKISNSDGVLTEFYGISEMYNFKRYFHGFLIKDANVWIGEFVNNGYNILNNVFDTEDEAKLEVKKRIIKIKRSREKLINEVIVVNTFNVEEEIKKII